MKAFSPVRSGRKSSLSEHSLGGLARAKPPSPLEDPLSLLYNMNDCYSKLKELVPSIPQNKKVSKMEILQHVIDYILDLQLALDSHPGMVAAAAAGTGVHLHPQRPPAASRTPLTTLNADISILSLQASEFPAELMTNDSKALYP